MENKKIDAACIGYAEESIPCERELQDLGEYSACTVVAHDIEVDAEGSLVGTMIISFGPEYDDKRKVDPHIAFKMAEIVNDVIDRRAADEDEDDEDDDVGCACECCEGSKYDVTENDVATLGEELKGAIDDFNKLLGALKTAKKQ